VTWGGSQRLDLKKGETVNSRRLSAHQFRESGIINSSWEGRKKARNRQVQGMANNFQPGDRDVTWQEQKVKGQSGEKTGIGKKKKNRREGERRHRKLGSA